VNVLLVDELDIAFDDETGFYAALARLAEGARCPIVLTANAVPAEARRLGFVDCVLEWRSPSNGEAADALAAAAERRGLALGSPDVQRLAAATAGDLRAGEMALHLLAASTADCGDAGAVARGLSTVLDMPPPVRLGSPVAGEDAADDAAGMGGFYRWSAQEAAAVSALAWPSRSAFASALARSTIVEYREGTCARCPEVAALFAPRGSRQGRDGGGDGDGDADGGSRRAKLRRLARSGDVAEGAPACCGGDSGAADAGAPAGEASAPADVDAAASSHRDVPCAAAPVADPAVPHAATRHPTGSSPAGPAQPAGPCRADESAAVAVLDALAAAADSISEAFLLEGPGGRGWLHDQDGGCGRGQDSPDSVAEADAVPSTRARRPSPRATCDCGTRQIDAADEARAILQVAAVRGCERAVVAAAGESIVLPSAAAPQPPQPAAKTSAGSGTNDPALNLLVADERARAARLRRLRDAQDARAVCVASDLLDACTAYAVGTRPERWTEAATSVVNHLRVIARLEVERKVARNARRFYHYLRKMDLNPRQIAMIRPLSQS